MLVKSPFLWSCHCSLPITFSLPPPPTPSLAWRETCRELWRTDYQEDDRVKPSSHHRWPDTRSSRCHRSTLWISWQTRFGLHFFFWSDGEKKNYQGLKKKREDNNKDKNRKWGMVREEERERKGGGNDPCIERLGSPTGILARMVHCLQTCWGLKLTLCRGKKKRKKAGRQTGRTWTLWR